MRPGWCRLATVVWLALLPQVAAAQGTEPGPSPAERSAVAETLFREGLELVRAGRYAQACPKFAESQRLEPRSGTAFNLARCRQMQGRLASAWASYLEAARLARTDHDGERAARARREAEALEPRLARLTIVVPDEHRIEGLVVRRDGLPLGASGWGVAVPVDPGDHLVEAAAPGRQRFERQVVIDTEGSETRLEIPLLAPEAEPATAVPSPRPRPPAPRPAPRQPPPATPRPRPPEPPARPAGPSPLRPWLLAGGFGLGAAGVLAGVVTGWLSLDKAAALAEACPDGWCHPALAGDRDAALDLATASNVSFAAGGAGLLVGVLALWLMDGGGEGAAIEAGALRLMPSPGGLVLGGRL